jgi:hypothetical protein
MASPVEHRIEKIIKAFGMDGFSVDRASDVLVCGENIGIRAVHTTAVIGITGKKKKVFYADGDPYTIGYFQGKLAEPDIERMCTEFNDAVIFDFIDLQIHDPAIQKILGDTLEDIVYSISRRIYSDIPPSFVEELEGILDGCKEVHPDTLSIEKASGC